MTHILVIGGSGNIGSPLVDTLAHNPDVELTVGVHNLDKARKHFSHEDHVQLAAFDFLDPATFPDAFAGVEKVFFIRPPQLAKPKQDMVPFLNYAKQQHIQHIVFVSLLGVEKNPMTPHHQIEAMIEKLQLPYTFIRPSFFMQNLSSTHLYDIQVNHDLFIPAGRAKTSFIDTRDIADVAAACLTSSRYLNQKLDITGAEALTYDQIATMMTQILGTPITYSRPSLLKFRRTMIKRGTPKEFVNVMVMLYLITQLGNAKTVNSTIESVLHRQPRSMADFITDYRAEFISAQ